MNLSPLSSGPNDDLPELEIIEPLCAVFRRNLKAAGLKYTPERAHVLDTILRIDDIFEADRLLDEVRATGFRVSKATVYRTIKLMLDASIIQRVLSNSDQARYQLAYGPHPQDLIVRLDTGESIHVELPELVEIRDQICKAHGLRAEGHRLQIFAVADESAASASS